MKTWARFGLLVAGLAMITLLVGCPGMPGGGGAGGNASQTPPGVLPPPGLTSGGVRTIVGATVTPPENSVLLVRFVVGDVTEATPAWISTRRISVTENAVFLEGLNFDGRAPSLPKDENRLLALAKVAMLEWKYEAKPTPPPSKTPAAGGPGQPAGPVGRGGAPPPTRGR